MTQGFLLENSIRIAKMAGKAIMEVYNDPDFEKGIVNKGNHSPLTQADSNAHLIIASEFGRITPEIPLLSEEGKQLSYSDRKNWDTFWLIDPLDGTKEFIKRNGEFAVHIALIEHGEAVLGVVHLPVLDTTYYAVKHQGSFKEVGNGGAQRITADQFRFSDENLRLVASRSHLSLETEEYMRQFTNPITLSMGSSMKFMLIADGRADIYPRLGPTMEWDTAAPQIIVEEAGGSVLDYQTQTPLRYNKENLLNEWFVVLGSNNN